MKGDMEKRDVILDIVNSLSNADILHLIPLISDRMVLWDNTGKQTYIVEAPEGRGHSLNGNFVQLEITAMGEPLNSLKKEGGLYLVQKEDE